MPLQERPQAPGYPVLPLQFWIRILSKSSNHQVMGIFLSLYILNCPYNTEANRQEAQPAVPKLCYSLTQHRPNNQTLSFQDIHDTIRKKHHPSTPIPVLMKQFALRRICCHVHLQNHRNFHTKVVNEK